MRREEMVAALKEFMSCRPVCPVTGGRVTRLTENGFRNACFLNRGLAFLKDSPMWCDTCRGEQRPMELEIVTLEELAGMAIRKKEEIMAVKNKEKGTCESCGKKGKMLKKHLDEMVCSTCEVLRMSCRLRPAIVMEQLIKMSGEEIAAGVSEAFSEKQRKAMAAIVLEKEKIVTELEKLREILESKHNIVIRLTSDLEEANNEIVDLKRAPNGKIAADPEAIQGSLETVALSGNGFDMVALQEFGWRLIGDLANSQPVKIQVEDIRLLLGHNGVGVSV